MAKYGMTPDQVADFSNAPLPTNNQPNAQGDYLLDLLAPGYWVVSSVAYPANTYAAYAGTSMAAPQVAGAWLSSNNTRPMHRSRKSSAGCGQVARPSSIAAIH
jgi:hypothetical protein